ncbi:ABC transporter ATP-binding protein [Oryzihumus leptocrescens]|uniref:ABC-2 type transport system ATP-binding protein/lipopolysaccharide transport system ATP-binding protein n=1 Tax=Oryzihumus leptocrescens TaxID=297536 RepID=A0A542ZHY9_9MICO|nr:ABC transporter ATP-binding protein [Oryzihumus leptocrescens]TQL59978.1 ABC-2 type transport system ATP-binding protein/lipopolysaccharide transport system ATP-binding protein [Oryzihumus leptocrescens]
MSTDNAVELRGVTRDFRLSHGGSGSIKHSILNRGAGRLETFRALAGVDLDIPRGATFALVGHNGSGKSTLLKLVAGIFPASQGAVHVKGRVTALLELGAGFHPELTGRENVYLAGSIAGLSRQDVDRDLQRIKDFSGLGEFFESPVKVYSSGMFVRLGFAVAVHMEPEILIIDEVVAVGDEEFQRQCFDHLHKLRRQGVTILFVSHSLGIVEQLADHAAWIDHGQVRAVGATRQVVDAYLSEVNRAERAKSEGPAEDSDNEQAAEVLIDDEVHRPHGSTDETAQEEPSVQEGTGRWGSGEARILDLEFLGHDQKGTRAVEFGESLTVRLHYEFDNPVTRPNFGLAVWSEQGWPIGAPNTRINNLETGTVAGKGHIDFRMERCNFVPGRLSFSAAITDHSTTHVYDWRDREFELKVLPGPGFSVTGLIEIPGTWSH